MFHNIPTSNYKEARWLKMVKFGFSDVGQGRTQEVKWEERQQWKEAERK